MLSLPTVLEDTFGRRYIFAGSHQGSPESFWGRPSAAESLVRQLKASDSYWRGLLSTHGTFDLRHALRDRSPQDLVADLLARGRLTIYALPCQKTLDLCSQYSCNVPSQGVQYRLLPRNGQLVAGAASAQKFASLAEAEKFVQSLGFPEQQLTQLASTLSSPAARSGSSLTQISHALLNGELVAMAYPLQAGGKAGKPADDDAGALSSPPPPTLGPHETPGYEPPPPKAPTAVAGEQPAAKPAQSLEECEQRLGEARERLKAQGYQPKYTDQEIQAQAETGELDDRFVVRFMETKYAADDGYLGRKEADGSVKYWSTTFNQLENADTDPKTICGVLGITYDPSRQYSVAIVDTQGKGAGQATTIVPTYKKLGEFAVSEVGGLDPAVAKEVMTPEYSDSYAKEMAAFIGSGGDLTERDDIELYSDRAFTSSVEREQFKTRAAVHQKLGANEHYAGDGTTKNILPGKGRCGVMETFTFDKNPKTLAHLKENGSLKVIQARPL